MKLLELFAGSRSIGKVAEIYNLKVFSVDMVPFEKIDYVVDILKFDYSKINFVPDFIWASPPCTYFSVASIGKHWNKDHSPKTTEAILGISIVEKTLEIINYYLKLNPNLVWFIENPRGKLRKLPIMEGLPLATVTYCSYGDPSMKPTDIWTNNLSRTKHPEKGWVPRDMCFNYKYDVEGEIINKHCHHESARRGSRTGTQGKKNNYDRSKIPFRLCKEIVLSTGLVDELLF